MNGDSEELVKVLETGDPALIAMAKSVLQDAGIEYSVTNEFLQNLAVTGQPNAMGIVVRQEDADAAQTILEPLIESEGELQSTDPSAELSETEEAADDQPITMDDLSYAAPKPEQPFSIRLLIVAAIFLIPIILAIIYSLQKD